MIVIPLIPSKFHYDLDVEIEDELFTIEMRWNERANLWSFSLYDYEGIIITINKAFVIGSTLGIRKADKRIPLGLLTVVDISNEGIEADFDTLSDRVQLVFFTRDEVINA